MRRLALVVVALSMVACGSTGKKPLDITDETTTSTPIATDGTGPPPTTTTTTTVRAVAKPQCAPPPVDTYDYTRDPDHLSAQQHELQGDIEKALQYGQAHADEYTSIGFVNHPRVSILGYFTGHLDRHRAALRGLVSHPDLLDVAQGVQTERDLQQMQMALTKDAEGHLRSSMGRPSGIVEVNLDATAAARRVAEQFIRAYEQRVCVALAGHPYPKGSVADVDQCGDLQVPSARVPDVTLELRLDATRVARGAVVKGTAHVTNNSSTPITYEGGTSIDGFVVEPGSSRPIGGQFGGVYRNDVARRYTAAAGGGTVDIPVIVGTDDCRKDADYSLPAGRYGVITNVGAFGRSNEVSLEIAD
jgi:hypothetical protein